MKYVYKIKVNNKKVFKSTSYKEFVDFFVSKGINQISTEDDEIDVEDYINDEDRDLGSERVYNEELCELGDDYVDLKIVIKTKKS